MPRSTKLAELDIIETSGVDHPAHLHEGWLVLKAATERIDVELEVNDTASEPVVEKATDSELLKELGDLRKELASMRAEKERIEAETELTKAVETASGWIALPGVDPAVVGAGLVELRKALPEVAALVEDILAKSAVALAEAGVLREVGVDAQPDENLADAWSLIETRANDLVANGEAQSFAKAVTLIAERDRDLYTRYLSEKGI